MATIKIHDAGKFGIIKDRLAHTLPLEAWSDGANVRFLENGVQRMTGHSPVWTPTVDPWALFPLVNQAEQQFWVYPGEDAVYVVDQDGVHTDLSGTSAPYETDFALGWNGGSTNGLLVLNNGVKKPQLWDPDDPGAMLIDLPNWPATHTTRVIRPLKEFLVALDLTEDGVRYPYKLRWSHPAEPGSVPISWDDSDETRDAGSQSMSDSGGFVTDLLPLKDLGIIYRRDQTWGLQYIGGASVFRLYRITKFGGVYSRNCVRAFMLRGEKHFVVTAGDVVIHDGQTAESVIEGRMRRWLFNQISTESFQRMQVVHNQAKSEMWICVPVSYDQLTRAAIWNYNENKWSIRDLPHANFLEAGQVNPNGVLNWDSDTEVWDTDATTWDEQPFPPQTDRLLMAVPGASRKLYLVDDTNRFDGVDYTAFVERVGLAVVDMDRDGTPKFDLSVRKLVKELWPKIDGPVGSQINIQVGTQEGVNDSVDWGQVFPFTIGVTQKINPLVSGKLIGVRFEMTGNYSCRLHGYDLELEILGKY